MTQSICCCYSPGQTAYLVETVRHTQCCTLPLHSSFHESLPVARHFMLCFRARVQSKNGCVAMRQCGSVKKTQGRRQGKGPCFGTTLLVFCARSGLCLVVWHALFCGVARILRMENLQPMKVGGIHLVATSASRLHWPPHYLTSTKPCPHAS